MLVKPYRFSHEKAILAHDIVNMVFRRWPMPIIELSGWLATWTSSLIFCFGVFASPIVIGRVRKFTQITDVRVGYKLNC